MSCQIPSPIVRLTKAESLGYCLPFLYCTQTILSKGRSRAKGYLSRCAYSTFQPNDIPKRTSIFEEDAFLRKPTEPLSTRNQEEAPKARRSTLTNAEQAAFNAIWTEAEERQQYGFDNDKAEANRPLHDLNEIFEHAILQIERRERRGAERVAKDRSYVRPVLDSLRDMPADSLPADSLPDLRPTLPSQPREEEMGESDAHVLVAVNEHRELVTKMLKAANSDMEVWNILESEVFIMFDQLQQHLAHQAKADKKQRKPRRKKETSKGGSGAVSNNHKMQELKGSASQKAFSPLLNESNALPTNAILTNLQANFAYYNILALRIWRRHHSRSTFALQLLPRIKSLGPISYVLGASTSLYNEVLFVKWTHFNDLHGVADLLNEMGNQGIERNDLTLSCLRFISRTRKADLAGQSGKVLQSWWDMRAVNDGWQRVRKIALQVQADLFKREREEQREQSKTETDDEQSWNTNMQNALDEEEDKTEETPKPSRESPFRLSKVSLNTDTLWLKKQKIRKVGSDSDRDFREVRQMRSGGSKATIS